MSRLKINENGRLYWEEVRGALYYPASYPDINLSGSQKEDLLEEISQNGGRPVEASKYLPKGWRKNKITGIS